MLIHILFSMTGRECRVSGARASTRVAEHLVEDPTRCLEPVVITGICTGDPGSIFVKRSQFCFPSDRKLGTYFSFFPFIQTTHTYTMIE